MSRKQPATQQKQAARQETAGNFAPIGPIQGHAAAGVSEREKRRLASLVSKIFAEDAKVRARGGYAHRGTKAAVPQRLPSASRPQCLDSSSPGGPQLQNAPSAGGPALQTSQSVGGNLPFTSPVNRQGPVVADPACPQSPSADRCESNPEAERPEQNPAPAGHAYAADSWWRNYFADRARCQFRDPAGRQCRLPRTPGDPTYCSRHASLRRAPSYSGQAAPDPQDAEEPVFRTVDAAAGRAIWLEEELLGQIENLRSATSINYVLGRLLLLKAVGVVGRRDAAVIAYICQLLLQSLPQVKQEQESAGAPEKDRERLGRVLESTSCLFPTPREDHSAPPTEKTSGE